MIQAVYELPAKYVGYIGLIWADRRNNTHLLPITRQSWVVFALSVRIIIVLSAF